MVSKSHRTTPSRSSLEQIRQGALITCCRIDLRVVDKI